MWLDDCRIPTNWKEERPPSWFNSGKSQSGNPTYDGNLKTLTGSTCGERLSDKGRFTPNLLVCDDMLNDGSVSKGQKNPRIQKITRRYGENNFTNGGLFTPEGNITATYNDMGSSSRYYDLDKWFDKVINEL
jgi:hypothetical protein